MTVIECHNLVKAYGNKRANNNISVTIREDTITGVIGRNGAGKTTLLKMIAGFLEPTSGQIHVFGQEPFQNLQLAANSIFVDDQMAFPATLSLVDILQTCGNFYPNWDAGLAERLLAYFELPTYQLHHRLSKGQKSTFNMIVGLSSRCPLTIFDEPTTGMDSSVRADFYRALLKDYLAHPRTILLSSHQVEEIEHLLEDVLLIDKGSNLLHMEIDDLRSYGLAVTGDAITVKQLTKDYEVIYKEPIGDNQLRIIIKNDGRLNNHFKDISVNQVPVHEMVVYLAKGEKGGIDLVFQ